MVKVTEISPSQMTPTQWEKARATYEERTGSEMPVTSYPSIMAPEPKTEWIEQQKAKGAILSPSMEAEITPQEPGTIRVISKSSFTDLPVSEAFSKKAFSSETQSYISEQIAKGQQQIIVEVTPAGKSSDALKQFTSPMDISTWTQINPSIMERGGVTTIGTTQPTSDLSVSTTGLSMEQKATLQEYYAESIQGKIGRGLLFGLTDFGAVGKLAGEKFTESKIYESELANTLIGQNKMVKEGFDSVLWKSTTSGAVGATAFGAMGGYGFQAVGSRFAGSVLFKAGTLSLSIVGGVATAANIGSSIYSSEYGEALGKAALVGATISAGYMGMKAWQQSNKMFKVKMLEKSEELAGVQQKGDELTVMQQKKAIGYDVLQKEEPTISEWTKVVSKKGWIYGEEGTVIKPTEMISEEGYVRTDWLASSSKEWNKFGIGGRKEFGWIGGRVMYPIEEAAGGKISVFVGGGQKTPLTFSGNSLGTATKVAISSEAVLPKTFNIPIIAPSSLLKESKMKTTITPVSYKVESPITKSSYYTLSEPFPQFLKQMSKPMTREQALVPVSSQGVGLSSRSNILQGQSVIQNVKQVVGQTRIQLQPSAQLVGQTTSLRQQLRTITPTIFGGGLGLPEIKLPSGFGGGGGYKKYKFKQKKKYRPSLYGIYSGKSILKASKLSTGMEPRYPVVRRHRKRRR